jgi:hypothetical protein
LESIVNLTDKIMSEDGSRNLEQNIKKERSYILSVLGAVFQPLWLRHRSILANRKDWEFMVRQFHYVLHCGLLFWTLFILSQKI